jgi:hypothetical protein
MTRSQRAVPCPCAWEFSRSLLWLPEESYRRVSADIRASTQEYARAAAAQVRCKCLFPKQQRGTRATSHCGYMACYQVVHCAG